MYDQSPVLTSKMTATPPPKKSKGYLSVMLIIFIVLFFASAIGFALFFLDNSAKNDEISRLNDKIVALEAEIKNETDDKEDPGNPTTPVTKPTNADVLLLAYCDAKPDICNSLDYTTSISDVSEDSIHNSSIKPYQTITVGLRQGMSGSAAFFFRASPQDDWVFFSRRQDAPACISFEFWVLHQAFADMECLADGPTLTATLVKDYWATH